MFLRSRASRLFPNQGINVPEKVILPHWAVVSGADLTTINEFLGAYSRRPRQRTVMRGRPWGAVGLNHSTILRAESGAFFHNFVRSLVELGGSPSPASTPVVLTALFTTPMHGCNLHSTTQFCRVPSHSFTLVKVI